MFFRYYEMSGWHIGRVDCLLLEGAGVNSRCRPFYLLYACHRKCIIHNTMRLFLSLSSYTDYTNCFDPGNIHTKPSIPDIDMVEISIMDGHMIRLHNGIRVPPSKCIPLQCKTTRVAFCLLRIFRTQYICGSISLLQPKS